jgi:hypothetical protein
MMSEAMNSAQNGANSHALKTVSRVCHKNDNEFDSSPPLKFAHLACVAVQHEGVKQDKYDASLYFFGALDNVSGAQHAYDVPEVFSGIAETLKSRIEYAQRANTLIHNKYYCDRKGCR